LDNWINIRGVTIYNYWGNNAAIHISTSESGTEMVNRDIPIPKNNLNFIFKIKPINKQFEISKFRGTTNLF